MRSEKYHGYDRRGCVFVSSCKGLQGISKLNFFLEHILRHQLT